MVAVGADPLAEEPDTLRRCWAGHRTLVMVLAATEQQLGFFGAEVIGVATATTAAPDERSAP